MRTYLGVSASLLLLLSLVVGCTIEEFPEALCYEDGTERLGDDLPKCCLDNGDEGHAFCASHYQSLYGEEAGTTKITNALAVCTDIGAGRNACAIEAELGTNLECLSNADCASGMLCGFGNRTACDAAGIPPASEGCSFCVALCDDTSCGPCALAGDGQPTGEIQVAEDGCE